MAKERRISLSKITAADFVTLLNRWQSSASKLQLVVTVPELTFSLSVFVTHVDFPTLAVALERNFNQFADNSEPRPNLARDSIMIHFSGCLLERAEPNGELGIAVRASWLSWKDRQIVLAELPEESQPLEENLKQT